MENFYISILHLIHLNIYKLFLSLITYYYSYLILNVLFI